MTKWYGAWGGPRPTRCTPHRCKDPKASLDFYCKTLGFNLVMYRELPEYEFNVYFVAPCDPSTIPGTPEEQWAVCMNLPGCIELTWNYGTETADGLVYVGVWARVCVCVGGG